MTQTFRAICSALLTVLVLAPLARPQGAKGFKDNLATAHNFLWNLYPDTRGKKYILTVEGMTSYDEANKPLESLILYVGEGPQYEYKRAAGGCMGTVPPVQLPSPPEWGPPSPAPRQSPRSATDPPDPDCLPGPVRYKQALSVHFQFDPDGKLLEFHILSPGFRQNDQRNKFGEFVLSHPGLTYAGVVAALKNAGAKYGPDDKEQFIKDLPVETLQRFLGKLQVASVSFQPLWEDRSNAYIWPLWHVEAKAKTANGEIVYEMDFEQFQGELTTLRVEQPRPGHVD